jgi:DNA-directed RNA polymerase specialized sigma24 family protein
MKIALLAGDGIGPEILREAVRVLDVLRSEGLDIETEEALVGGAQHRDATTHAAREGASFPDRARFMGYAARVMRGLIIDDARSRHAAKRGGGVEITSLDAALAETIVDGEALSEIGDALDELAKTDPALAEIVDLKFFCGFTLAEVANYLGVRLKHLDKIADRAETSNPAEV